MMRSYVKIRFVKSCLFGFQARSDLTVLLALSYFLLRYSFIGWFKASWAKVTNKKTASLDGALCSCSVIRSIYPDLQMRIEHLFQEHFNIQIINILTFRIYICVTYPPVLPIDFFAKINILFHLFLTKWNYFDATLCSLFVTEIDFKQQGYLFFFEISSSTKKNRFKKILSNKTYFTTI